VNKNSLRGALVALALWGTSDRLAHAGDFQASPVKVYLDGKNRSALVMLVNTGAGPLRVQIDAFSWTEDEDGKQVLGPPADLTVFPTLLELAVGETRAIRVGATAPVGPRERTYRVLIEELPSDQESSLGVNLRMRMSLPVFVAEHNKKSDLRVSALALGSDEVAFVLANRGERHIKPQEIILTQRDASGRESTERLPGWYILAGQTRRYRLPRAADTCITRVDVRVVADERTFERSEAVADPRCAPNQRNPRKE